MFALRPLSRQSPRLFRTRTAPRPFVRTMASSTTTPLQEWLVILPDHVGALDKRLAARPDHLANLKQDRDDMWLWGGTSSSFPSLMHQFHIDI
jgi:hypothetical protein